MKKGIAGTMPFAKIAGRKGLEPPRSYPLVPETIAKLSNHAAFRCFSFRNFGNLSNEFSRVSGRIAEQIYAFSCFFICPIGLTICPRAPV
jgi:hypothetical protein